MHKISNIKPGYLSSHNTEEHSWRTPQKLERVVVMLPPYVLLVSSGTSWARVDAFVFICFQLFFFLHGPVQLLLNTRIVFSQQQQILVAVSSMAYLDAVGSNVMLFILSWTHCLGVAIGCAVLQVFAVWPRLYVNSDRLKAWASCVQDGRLDECSFFCVFKLYLPILIEQDSKENFEPDPT